LSLLFVASAQLNLTDSRLHNCTNRAKAGRAGVERIGNIAAPSPGE
jgi:hypothetical protein